MQNGVLRPFTRPIVPFHPTKLSADSSTICGNLATLYADPVWAGLIRPLPSDQAYRLDQLRWPACLPSAHARAAAAVGGGAGSGGATADCRDSLPLILNLWDGVKICNENEKWKWHGSFTPECEK